MSEAASVLQVSCRCLQDRILIERVLTFRSLFHHHRNTAAEPSDPVRQDKEKRQTFRQRIIQRRQFGKTGSCRYPVAAQDSDVRKQTKDPFIEQSRTRARAVKEAALAAGSTLSLQQAYDVMAAAAGHRNWATMKAGAQRSRQPVAGKVNASMARPTIRSTWKPTSEHGFSNAVLAYMAANDSPYDNRMRVFLPPFISCLMWMRTIGFIDFNLAEIRDRLDFTKVLEMADPLAFPNMPASIRLPLQAYLASIPGYRADQGYRQGITASEHHASLMMQIHHYFENGHGDLYGSVFHTYEDRVLFVSGDRSSRDRAFREIAAGFELLVVKLDETRFRPLSEVLPAAVPEDVALVLDEIDRVNGSDVATLCLFIDEYECGPLHFGCSHPGFVAAALQRRVRQRRFL